MILQLCQNTQGHQIALLHQKNRRQAQIQPKQLTKTLRVRGKEETKENFFMETQMSITWYTH